MSLLPPNPLIFRQCNYNTVCPKKDMIISKPFDQRVDKFNLCKKRWLFYYSEIALSSYTGWAKEAYSLTDTTCYILTSFWLPSNGHLLYNTQIF